jgi:methylmalonyl-CoA/ethylmalonyl-CoA epimerase
MIGRIAHIAIAVANLKEAAAAYEAILGSPMTGEETVSDQGVRVGFFQVGESRIELLEPTGSETPVGRYLRKNGPGLHHIGLEVDRLAETLRELEGRGVHLIDREPRAGAGGHQIAFVHPAGTGGVLVELSEKAHSSS